MKVGMRTPNLKKSFKARTTGKAKRAAMRAINPAYGKKGTGMITNPKKAMYNKVYNKTTFSATNVLSGSKITHTTKAATTARNRYPFCTITAIVYAVALDCFTGLTSTTTCERKNAKTGNRQKH